MAAKKPKKAKAPRKKKARSLSPKAEAVKKAYHVRLSDIRLMAAQDYITDQQHRSVGEWHVHSERTYKDAIGLRQFRVWAIEDGWTPRREAFWETIEQRVLEARSDQLFEQRIAEVQRRTEERDAMAEYLQPRRDPDTGGIMRHPFTVTEIKTRTVDGQETEYEVTKPHPYGGLPVMSLELPRYDQMVSAFVKFNSALLVMRGETTSRTEVRTKQTTEGVHLGASAGAQNDAHLTQDDIEAMARYLLGERQPELGILEADGEEVDDGE
jgi:hypothetical protein